jgi:carbamoyltransferase
VRIVGISAYYHDAAAALVDDGNIVAAAQEERFTRRKHDPRFPHYALQSCLAQANVTLADVDHVVYYEKPFVKFERLLETYLAFAPRGFASFRRAMPSWLREKVFQKSLLVDELKKHDAKFGDDKLLFSEHHLSHAASAFFPSPFHDALVLTMDGVGEHATTSVALGSGRDLEIVQELHFPHSLGMLYSAFTHYTGFKVNSGEYKVMGLAPYGTPRFAQSIFDDVIDLKADGTFRVRQEFFDYCTGVRMTNDRFDALFGGPARAPESLLTQRDLDLAASIQAVTEEIVLRLVRALVKETGRKQLCLAGGVALNCVANGKILRDGCVDDLWIQPAAGDAGGALGAALVGAHLFRGVERNRARDALHDDGAGSKRDSMNGAFLGPSYSSDDVAARLSKLGAKFARLSEAALVDKTADALAEGKAVGWFHGRAEFGPRALGGRSILADPRSATMQSTLNVKIKFRESFRPFAPSVLREHVSEWFDLDVDSPYMLLVADVAEAHRRAMTGEENARFGIDKLNVVRSTIPAVTHVDYSARIQTVHRETNPRYHALLEAFFARTGCPVVVNTSFNVRGEPIVGSPEDAFRCFMGTDLDVLAIEDCFLVKSEQPAELARRYDHGLERD